jgi:superfamily I DNA and/or RNA helicase
LYVTALKAAGLEKVRIVTADSFQGWDVRIVMWDMVSGSNMGAGFTADLRRINVSITRQMEGLVIVWDSGSLRKNSEISNPAKLRVMYDWLPKKGRVVTVPANITESHLMKASSNYHG